MRRQTRRLVVMAAGVLCLLVGMGWHFGVVSGQPTPSPSPIGMATPAPSPARIARPPIDNDQPPPALIAQVSETEKPQPLTLTRVVTDVTVVGFLAETRTTLTFRNDFARVLEGELVFPLPEGATVSGYALDVNGVMIDGVVVGQREARIAFEKETRKGVDPGLVEWVKGSSFKTRVFPIPPNGTRTIRIDTVSDLVTQGDVSKLAALYHLPLRYPNAVGEFSLRVEVVKPSAPPEVRSGSLANFRFARFEERYVAETRLHDARLTEDLMIALPQVPRENVVVERGEDGEFYFTIDDFPAIPALAPMQAKRIAVLWDASLSRAKADHARELRLLRSLIARLKDVEVDLTIFREVSQKTERIAIRGGQCESLLKRIETLPYDGATDLSALRVEKDVAYALLFSDGIGTLKEGLPDAASVPIFTINGDAQADHGVLRHMAERSGGAYFNLARLDDESVMTALGVRPFVLAGVDCNEKEITDLLPSGERPVQGRVTITGRLMVPEARVVLRYGKGEAAQMRTYTLRQSDAARTHLVSRYWAQQRIAELSVFAERNHDEIVSLGRRFGIVTPGTSLLVLETVEQYLEHGIEPPRSQPQMREEYLRLSQERVTQKTGSQKAKLERVAQMWKQRTDWWARDFKYDPQQIAKQTADGRRQRNGGHAEADRSLSVQESRAPMRDEVLGVAEAPAPPPPSRPADAPARAGSGMAPSATQEVMADAAKQKKSNGDGEHASAATIAIQAWDPKTPYLAAMKAVPLGDAYAVYLKEREKFGQSPAFFLDCADFFLRAKERALGLRILTNIVELKLEDARLLRVAAHRLEQAEALDWAITIFEKVHKMRPEEPQSPRDLALALCARADARRGMASQRDNSAIAADYSRALGLFNEIVLGEWDGRFPEIEVVALMDANRVLAIMEREQIVSRERCPIDERLIQALPLDLRITMTWDTDMTDMDLWVTEPSGEKCFYSHNLTAIGGMISRDFTGGYGPEEYLVKRALAGAYKVQTNFYGSRSVSLTGPTTVQAIVITDFGRSSEKRQALTLRLSEAREVVDIGTVNFAGAASIAR